MDCTCDVPSKANYHTEVIIGRDIPDVPGGTETTDVQLYRCAEHVEEWQAGDCYRRARPDEMNDWVVLESTTTHLRGDV